MSRIEDSTSNLLDQWAAESAAAGFADPDGRANQTMIISAANNTAENRKKSLVASITA